MPPTTRRIKLVGKKKFAAAALDPKYEAYVVYVGCLSSTPLVASLDVHLFLRPQISGLIAKEAPMKVFVEYLDFVDIFSPDLATELLEYTEINTYAINLKEDKQPPYGPIYSLGPVELETLKTYININLANSYICSSKSSASAPILFDKKLNRSLCLSVDYWGLNNITIKNRYLVSLVGESLDRPGYAKQFTQLDLTSVYHQKKIKEDDKWKKVFQIWYRHFE